MIKALIFKEWTKTRIAFAISLVIALAASVYAVLMMSRLIELKGAEHMWLIMLLKDNMFVDAVKYIPVFVGIGIAMAQMTPETAHKRLKLTLHLPYPQNKLILLMLATGITELAVIFALQLAILVIYDTTILPPELVKRMVLTTLPWFIGGFTAYLFVTAVCLEGTRYMKTVIALLGIAVVFLFYLQPAPEAFNGILFAAIVFTALLAILSIGSVIRFKEGRQD